MLSAVYDLQYNFIFFSVNLLFFWTWKNLNETLDTNVAVQNLIFVH